MGAGRVKVARPVVHGEMDDDEGGQQAGSMVANARVGVGRKVRGGIFGIPSWKDIMKPTV